MKKWDKYTNTGATRCRTSHTIISFDRSAARNKDNAHFSLSVLCVSQTRQERPEIFLAARDVSRPTDLV